MKILPVIKILFKKTQQLITPNNLLGKIAVLFENNIYNFINQYTVDFEFMQPQISLF